MKSGLMRGGAFALLGWATLSTSAQGLHFSEVADAAGVRVKYIGPLTASFFNCGGAVGDFNNDGWPDLFLLGGGGAGGVDRLFINNGDGTFTDRAAEWGVALTHIGFGSAVGDYDRDGWQDIYITSRGISGSESPGNHILYHNNGGQSFTNVATAAGVNRTAVGTPDGFGAAWGDYDLDGWLDLFVAGWVTNSGGNRLFHNNRDGTFTDVTTTAIQFDLTSTHGFAPRFVDMNGDGYPELLLAADYGTSRYLINNGDGTFTEHTALSGLGLDTNGMGQAVGDFNRDGLLDWYVTSIYDSHTLFGNALYIATGPDTFLESSRTLGVSNGGWGWGTVAADFDHNGWLDLVATNGWSGGSAHDPTKLFMNSGFVFSEAAVAAGVDHTGQGRGLLSFDYDRDGDEDFVIFSNGDYLRLYRNDLSGPNTHWLKVSLSNAGRSNLAPSGLGSLISITINGQTQIRPLCGGDNYLSQSELTVHFGLADATVVDELRVRWATGEETVMHNVVADQQLTIAATLLTGDITGDGRVDLSDLGVMLSAYGICSGALGYDARADLVASGCIDLSDLGVLLSHYGESLW